MSAVTSLRFISDQGVVLNKHILLIEAVHPVSNHPLAHPIIMPVHTARRHGKAFISLRYTLMVRLLFICLLDVRSDPPQSFHIIVWAICLILTSLNVNTFLALIIIAASGVALVIYIPAAIVLCRRRSTSHFDHAGGEVAYLVTQQALSLSKSCNYTD